jgi:hypothetical protein
VVELSLRGGLRIQQQESVKSIVAHMVGNDTHRRMAEWCNLGCGYSIAITWTRFFIAEWVSHILICGVGIYMPCKTSHFVTRSLWKLKNVMIKKDYFWVGGIIFETVSCCCSQACNPLHCNSPTDIFHSGTEEPFPICHGHGPGSPDSSHDLFQVTRRNPLDHTS